ncbi:MAG: hypothetical protein M1834_009491 [Cirrosporium novae-zelandiae]|nr:MAG: hypothetical protein M1834_009491 [Cirrosporium novae-zelandiae]
MAKALVTANTYPDTDSRRAIANHTKGFCFLGTPHKGSRLTVLGKICCLFGYYAGSSSHLLETIEPGSQMNRRLHHDFITQYRSSEIVCFHGTVLESLFGIPITPAKYESATIAGAENATLDTTHRNIQRAGSDQDKNYRGVLWGIRKTLEKVEPLLEKLLAAAKSGNVDRVKELIDYPYVDPNKPNDEGKTALELAAHHGHIDVVQLLLDKCKVDPDLADEVWGQSHLFRAAKGGHVEIVRRLLNQDGVDPNHSDKYGITPLAAADEAKDEAKKAEIKMLKKAIAKYQKSEN